MMEAILRMACLCCWSSCDNCPSNVVLFVVMLKMIDVDLCYPNPCPNNGICYPGIGQFTCVYGQFSDHDVSLTALILASSREIVEPLCRMVTQPNTSGVDEYYKSIETSLRACQEECLVDKRCYAVDYKSYTEGENCWLHTEDQYRATMSMDIKSSRKECKNDVI